MISPKIGGDGDSGTQKRVPVPLSDTVGAKKKSSTPSTSVLDFRLLFIIEYKSRTRREDVKGGVGVVRFKESKLGDELGVEGVGVIKDKELHLEEI